jgi:hypothetical protein
MSEQPEGIDHPLDSSLAKQDHLDEEGGNDLQSGSAQRKDPDDPEAAIQQATEESRGQ